MGLFRKLVVICAVLVVVTAYLLLTVEEEGTRQVDSMQAKVATAGGSGGTVAATANKFRVATCNVLFEPYYTRHCKAQAVMPYRERLESWIQFVRNPQGLFRQHDIVLLQEFAGGDRDWTQAFDGTPYRLVTAKIKQDSSAVAYNSEVYSEVLDRDDGGVMTHEFGKGKTAVKVLLRHKDLDVPVYAVSAHLPWSMSADAQVATLQEIHDFAVDGNVDAPTLIAEQLLEMGLDAETSKKMVQEHIEARRHLYSGEQVPVLLGGDFNIAPFVTQLALEKKLRSSDPTPDPGEGDAAVGGGSKADHLKALQDNPNSDTLPVFTASTGWMDLTRSFPWTHMGRGGPVRLDFVLSRGFTGIGTLSSAIRPDTANELVKHDPHDPAVYGPPYSKSFFSDHAFVGVGIL